MFPGLRHPTTAFALVALVVGTVLGLLYPETLVGAGGWSITVAAVLFGLGATVGRGFRIELGLGEQLALGTVMWLFLSGVLLAIGCASRGPLLVIAAAGVLLAAFELATTKSPPKEPAESARWVGQTLAMVLAAFLGLNLLAMVAARGNAFDDHVAYTAFVKRMLDCGDLIEPYSFRRLAAYGGQTSLLALAALRGDVQSSDLLDRGIYQWIAVAVALDLMRRRGLGLAVKVVVVTSILLLWNYVSINSAAAWTGFTCFIAAYTFAAREDLSPRVSLLLVFATCGAACTLRQNYLLPAGLFAALLLVNHLREAARTTSWRIALRNERRLILLASAAALALVVPYAIATYRSNHTFLYPFAFGTYNAAAPLRPTGATFFDEIAYFFNVFVLSVPLQIWWLLLPVMLLAREVRARRPWYALLAACLLGLVVLTHGFLQSDAGNMWRYAFGYMAPLAVVFYIETASQLPGFTVGDPPLRLASSVVVIAWLALLVQFFETRSILVDRINFARDNVKAGLALGSSKADRDYIATYQRMQASAPQGAPLAVLLDEAYLLDYARNEIVNLDLPGFSAPGDQLPSFTTPLNWRCYFVTRGIRHIAFVDSDKSSYLYRRRVWLWRMYSDEELWRFMAAHIVDATDTFKQLAKTSTVLFHEEGLTLIDLGAATCTEPSRGEPELVRMDAYIRNLSEHELGNNSWQLASRRTVAFQLDGYGPSEVGPRLETTPTRDDSGLVQLLFGKPLRDPPHRWLTDRTHIRVLGEREQQLHIRIWVNTARLFTTPRLAIWLDGTTLAHGSPDEHGFVDFNVRTRCRGWCDLYILVSSMHEFWRAAEDLNAIKLLEFDWNEATP